MLIDRFGRIITNLRIAITMKCNLNCIYCHREGQKESKKENKTEMSVEEISKIAKAFKELGIKKVKITGGEPLLRRDVCDIISSMPDFKEISMTTNGIYLSKLAWDLKDSGLDRVNVSLDSLRRDVYKYITRGGDVNKVIDGIATACDAKLTPIKVNMVILKGLNDDQVSEMMEFISNMNSESIKTILQVIEILKLPGLEKYYKDITNLEKEIASKAEAVILRGMHFRRQYKIGNVVVEFIKPVNNREFCMHCNRIRVTSDGKVKPCLMRDEGIKVVGLEGKELINAIKKAVNLREPYY